MHVDTRPNRDLRSYIHNGAHRHSVAISIQLHGLASDATDLCADHAHAHAGHPWNELADSAAK
eukprot:1918729-Pyramimonas_sp.AAC.1